MGIKKSIGTRINTALARCGMLQKDLANVLGVTPNTISYYCKGTRGPQLEQLPKIAEALNTTTDYLLCLTDDPNIQKSAVDDLGLAPTVICKIKELEQHSSSDCDRIEQINRVLDDENVWTLLFLIHDYITATKAEAIYDSLIEKHDGDETTLSRALLTVAAQHKDTDIDMYDFLVAKAKSHMDGPLVRLGLNESSLSELIYLRIDRQIHKTLTDIEEGAINDND